jgi:hypothetical protein
MQDTRAGRPRTWAAVAGSPLLIGPAPPSVETKRAGPPNHILLLLSSTALLLIPRRTPVTSAITPRSRMVRESSCSQKTPSLGTSSGGSPPSMRHQLSYPCILHPSPPICQGLFRGKGEDRRGHSLEHVATKRKGQGLFRRKTWSRPMVWTHLMFSW